MARNLTHKPLTMGMASGWVPSMGLDWKKAPSGWCYRDCESVVPLADAIFYHSYSWNVTFKRLEFQFWSKITSDLGADKGAVAVPLAITEFGNRPGDSVCMDAMLATEFNASTAVYELFAPGKTAGLPAQGIYYANYKPIVAGEAACLGNGAASALYIDACDAGRGGGGPSATLSGNWTADGGRYGGPAVRPQFGVGCYLTASEVC
jgi:hypothetical protein